MNQTERGTVTRYVQIGKLSLIICGVALAIDLAVAIFLIVSRAIPAGQAGSIFLVAILLVLAGAMLATLTIEVDDRSVCWYFTARILYRRVAFADIAGVESWYIPSMSFGYRMGYKKRAWIVDGTGSIVIEVAGTEMQYLIGCNDPDAVCAEIERRHAIAH